MTGGASPLPLVLHHHHRNIVRLSCALRERAHGLLNRIVNRGAGFLRVARHDLAQAFLAEELASLVLRFGHAVGVDHDLVAGLQRLSGNLERGLLQQSDRHGGGRQLGRDSAIAHQHGRAMSRVYVTERTAAFHQAVENRRVFLAAGAVDQEVVEAFLELVATPEFRTEAIDCITAFKKNFGESKLGYIKTSNRKGNPAAQEALAKASGRGVNNLGLRPPLSDAARSTAPESSWVEGWAGQSGYWLTDLPLPGFAVGSVAWV